jgi:phage terminase large subunit GpA-like protein
MEHAIAKLMRERIASGLKRKSVTSCSKWAETYRFVDKPYVGNWSFRYLPWQRGMHDSDAPLNVGQKSAQAGYTETVLNRTFYMIDVKGVDCLYVLPSSTPDASDFSASRFDSALDLSPHLAAMFSDVKNIGHKRAGSSNLYIRGSRSRSQLKSIPVGFIVLDELDEMEQDNIPLALQRTAGQFESQVWMLSTPTIPDEGINKYFKTSNQEHFFFKCPGCSRPI